MSVIEIALNGKKTLVERDWLNYEDVLHLAGFDRARILSVAFYGRLEGEGIRQGILSPGRGVVLCNGMRFTIADTSNA